MTLNPDFTENIKNVIPADERAAFFDALNGQPLSSLRVNTLKTSPAELLSLLKMNENPVPWCKTGFYCDTEERLSKSPYFYGGLFYIQEPSAMLSASVLDITPGDRVLDLCASPGGKTTQIAARLNGTGVLVSNDANPSRVSSLIKNIERMGVTNALILNETPERLAAKFSEYFDKILVDAPCSGEGMFRKDKNAQKAWDAEKSGRLAAIQRGILEQAAKMLKKGGALVYSTCTFSVTENEEQIENFLSSHADFEQLSCVFGDLGVSQGLDGKSARIFPHRQAGEGHFCALLRKRGELSPNLPAKPDIVKINNLEWFHEFCYNYLNSPLPESFTNIREHNGLLFVPTEIDVSGLRVSRHGFCLGYLKKNRFEPVGAFALGLPTSSFKYSVDFAEESDDLRRFLAGEAFPVDAQDGYLAVTVSGHTLDFVKIVGGRLKWRARNTLI
ncbi:methylase [Clostridia bacterium]|nr:methylase [Clostridia bacterium]